MDALKSYLRTLSAAEAAAFACRCGTSIGYLRKAVSVGARMDGALCRRLDEESGGRVSRAALRPDIWPELATVPGIPGDSRREAA